jgi:hypothetical protein
MTRKTGDRYIDSYEGKIAVRTVRADGNDSYVANGAGLFNGVKTFETMEEAQAYLDSHKKKEISKASADFIRRHINGEVKGKYLYGVEENGDIGRIELVGANLEFYNSLRSA